MLWRKVCFIVVDHGRHATMSAWVQTSNYTTTLPCILPRKNRKECEDKSEQVRRARSFEEAYWSSDNIHEGVDPIIINLDSDDEDELFLDSDDDD